MLRPPCIGLLKKTCQYYYCYIDVLSFMVDPPLHSTNIVLRLKFKFYVACVYKVTYNIRRKPVSCHHCHLYFSLPNSCDLNALILKMQRTYVVHRFIFLQIPKYPHEQNISTQNK